MRVTAESLTPRQLVCFAGLGMSGNAQNQSNKCAISKCTGQREPCKARAERESGTNSINIQKVQVESVQDQGELSKMHGAIEIHPV